MTSSHFDLLDRAAGEADGGLADFRGLDQEDANLDDEVLQMHRLREVRGVVDDLRLLDGDARRLATIDPHRRLVVHAERFLDAADGVFEVPELLLGDGLGEDELDPVERARDLDQAVGLVAQRPRVDVGR